MNGKSPLALYIHIPFCSKKCHYCSFYTIPHKPETVALYCNAIIREGKKKLASIRDHYYVNTLFFGGGTPSLVPPSKLEEIISTLAPQAKEITLEANPENLSEIFLHSLRQTQINRISLGVQTFDDPLLRLLGRTHTSSHAIKALQCCKAFDFINLSIDLIYGLPTQTLESFLCDLQQALKLPLTHISLYNLTIDPHTSFYKHRKVLASTFASDEILATMSSLAEELLTSHGFARYELGSYAKPGYESKHNLCYWTDRPFLGLGVSASQYLQGERSKNVSRISSYLRSIYRNLPIQEFSETLSEKEKIKEALSLRLRLIEGAQKKDFPKELWEALEKCSSLKQLFEYKDHSLALNKRGRLFHDTVAEEIMGISF
ncbi:radical SAM family heme chaperone HemW [Chlamydia sp. 17-3921]|uniref:radical SAM family heme chaperone HemW n=1 Tax=Chlamydia sp. 17-3921 TaxID=2675798 RepID=UPI00191A1FD1|nr:radical SAM family heme chaperone HemW [Chlamydia sp. 17-3921]